MKSPKPADALPPDALEALAAYETGQISPDVAAERFLDALKGGEGAAVQLDRPLREAIVRLQVARGVLPPGTALDPDE
jgi:hypothetical protein